MNTLPSSDLVHYMLSLHQTFLHVIETMVQGTSSLKYFLPVAQESLSAITAWVFYCPKVTDPLGLGKGEKG